jgi:DNA mismatch repair protein MutS
MPKKLTPAQQQYADLKRQHSDAILFFRLGDFYETFHEDAQIAHRELDITLTAKNKSAPHPIPMAGVPHHSLEKYVQRLVDSGYKVAIADQVGEVTPGKVVDREVVRVVTPGTTISDRPDFQFIAAITQLETPEQSYHLVW